MQRRGQHHAEIERTEISPVRHDDLNPTALLLLEYTRMRSETHRNESDAGQIGEIQDGTQAAIVDVRRAKLLEWTVGATPHAQIAELKKPDARVEKCRGQAAHVRRWIGPR